MVSVDAVLAALVLEPAGEDHYRAENVATGHPVVFGGQLLAQSVIAGLQGHEGKAVKTLHTVFARSADPDAPVEISVDRVHTGRALASSTVTISQGDRVCTRSMVLLTRLNPISSGTPSSTPCWLRPLQPVTGRTTGRFR